jgi:hypothetical protein
MGAAMAEVETGAAVAMVPAAETAVAAVVAIAAVTEAAAQTPVARGMGAVMGLTESARMVLPGTLAILVLRPKLASMPALLPPTSPQTIPQ